MIADVIFWRNLFILVVMCDTHPFARSLAINVGVSADCVLFILSMSLTPEQHYLGYEALKCLTFSGNILTINVLARIFSVSVTFFQDLFGTRCTFNNLF